MCIKTTSLPLCNLPILANELASSQKLLKLIFEWQQNSTSENYNKVQKFLVAKNNQFNTRQRELTTDQKFEDYVVILDGDYKIQWTTIPENLKPKQSLLYQPSEIYSGPYQNYFKKFEDGNTLIGSSVSGPGTYPGAKALIFGVCVILCCGD